MQSGKIKNKQARHILVSYLRENHLRVTPERLRVLDAALEMSDHFNADELFVILKNKKIRVSRATVYNSLEILNQCNILVKRHFGDKLTRYENNFEKTNHEHLLCVRCGNIIEFRLPEISRLAEKICRRYGYDIVNYSFNIKATCHSPSKCGASRKSR